MQTPNPTENPTTNPLDAASDRLLTVPELAEILRLHPGSVRRLALQGRIPSLHVGRSIRFRLSDVLSAMEGDGHEAN